MRARSLCLALLSAAMCLVLCGCAGWHSVSRQSSEARFSDRTETRTWDLTVREDATRVELELDIDLSRGHAAWELRDADGVLRWEGKAASGKRFRRTEQFEPLQGEWTLTLAIEQGAGRYAWTWASGR